jgi:hypothetical protein
VLHTEPQGIHGALHVRAQIADRIGERPNQGDLSGDVEDGVRSGFERVLQIRSVRHVPNHVFRSVGRVLPPAGRFVVEEDDIVPVGDQRVCEMRPDEAGPARDENLHWSRLTW